MSAVADLSQETRFWLYASGWVAAFDRTFVKQGNNHVPSGWDGKGAPERPRPAPQVPESKEDRERKIARVEIFPGDITLETGQQAVFTAVARDKDGAPISGLDVSWEGFDEDKNQSITIAQSATFASGKQGKFKLTANIAGRQAHVKVTVVGVERMPNTSSQGEPVSSHDQPKPKISLFAPVSSGRSQVAMRNGAKSVNTQRSLRASASALSPSTALFLPGEDDYGWNSGNYTTADDLRTERGNPPGHAVDGGAGSGNFQFTAPLLGLDGRGLDLNLGFNYNSRLRLRQNHHGRHVLYFGGR
jgi:hypothetical protein